MSPGKIRLCVVFDENAFDEVTFRRGNGNSTKTLDDVSFDGMSRTDCTVYIVELQWLKRLWNHDNIFETGEVRANECQS